VGRGNAATLGGDRVRLAVGGDSAGGNLAAVAALMARDRGEPPLAFQLLLYPATNYAFNTPSYRENAEGYLLTRAEMVRNWRAYLRSEADGHHPYASPLGAPDLSGLPPALVVTAEYDPLRDEGEAYAKRLREAGVPAGSIRYPGMIHGFVGLAGVLDRAEDAIREAGQALRAAFAGGGRPGPSVSGP
jgi:acetyl esterase/lipase